MLTVERVSQSSYFSDGFLAKEQTQLESQLNIRYQKSWELNQLKPQILITNTHTDLSKLPESTLENLELIIHPNSGYDNFSADWVAHQKIPIVLGNSIRAGAVTETIIASFINRYIALPKSQEWVSKRDFQRRLITDLNILIIGAGMIGQQVARKLKPLVGQIQFFDPFKNYLELDLNKADVIIVAASLNPTSANFIDKAFLSECKPGFTLINTARGGIVNEVDLREALANDPLAFAYLDVFKQEPTDFSSFLPFIERGQMICTSHIAGVFDELEAEMIKFEQEIIQNFLKTRENPEIFLAQYSEQLLANRLHRNFLI